MRTVRATADLEAVRSIVVLRALYLGDMLCSLPAMRALRQRFPAARITLIGLPWVHQLMDRLPGWVDEILTFPGYPGLPEMPYDPQALSSFLSEQAARDYDLAIQMHGDGRVSNFFAAQLGARFSIGYSKSSEHPLSHALPYPTNQHEVHKWLRLVAALGARSRDTSLCFPLTAAERDRAQHLLAVGPQGTGPLIVLHPGAKDPNRRWPVEKLARLGRYLVDLFGARLVLTGSADERHLADAIEATSLPALNLAGHTDIGTFAAVIAEADLVVTNDTGASHIAAATATPSVVLFGPTSPAQWAPLDRDRHVAIDAARHSPHRDDPGALQELPVEPVFDACLALLRKYPPGRGMPTVTSTRWEESE